MKEKLSEALLSSGLIFKETLMAQSKLTALEGNEIADDYVRTQVPQKRWSDTWNVFKSNLGKLFIINLLTLLFFTPGIGIVIFRLNYISQLGLVYPFSNNALFMYPFTPSTQGVAESITLSADLLFYSLLVVAVLIASIGLSGACYSVKKLINTHGEFSIKSYFTHGVKKCYFNTLLPAIVFMFFMFGSLVISDWAAQQIAYGRPAGGPITAQVFIIIATVVVGIIAMWVLAVGVSYKVKFKYLMKNSFVLLFGTIFQTLFMIGFSLIPVWLLLIGMNSTLFLIIGGMLCFCIGFSFILLCWFAYTQWVFDMFITPAIKTEKEAKRAQMSPKQLEAEKEAEEKAIARELLAAGRSELIGRPLRPIAETDSVGDIGVAFDRGDISRVGQERQSLVDGVNEYYEQHKKDTRYVEYEKMFAEREKALQSPKGKKGKGKSVSSDNLLRK